MKLTHEKKDGVTIVHVSGKIIGGPDVDSVNQLFRDLLSQGDVKIIVELAELAMINSSGLGSLIANMTAIRKQGGTLKFANVSENVMHVLKITRLDTVFEIHASLQEALATFSN
jgi:anti-sigma B factor antagonist